MRQYTHSSSEVCSPTPYLPVPEHPPIPESDHNVATAPHDLCPATAIHTHQTHDNAQFGDQYGAWSSGGGAGSGWSVPLTRGVSEPGVPLSTTTVHCTAKYDVPRVPPTLLPYHISPLPGYGQSGVCVTGVGSMCQGLPQSFSH